MVSWAQELSPFPAGAVLDLPSFTEMSSVVTIRSTGLLYKSGGIKEVQQYSEVNVSANKIFCVAKL